MIKAVLAGGHLTDSPDRPEPRFPEACVPRVRRQIDRELRDIGFGRDDVLVCGGARGADILAAEAARARGGRVHVVLAMPREQFLERSVAMAGTDWAGRFDAVLATSDVAVQPDPPPGTNAFDAINARLVSDAITSGDPQHALVVWDGAPGERPGGTASLARLAVEAGMTLTGIDPTPAGSADRQWAEGPKKVLALDGGGIRGVLSLGILEQIEGQLRDQSGRKDLVLADYFDYMAGTSTGAIIATALSLGLPVADVLERYRQLGKKVFRLNWLTPFVALHPSKPLTAELERLIGGDRTLGDPELRTLLLLVLHDIDSDSPWPLSNCRTAKYNRPERRLAIHPQRATEWVPDRNLDLSLAALVRGSTAAPFYFRPQDIKVGARPTWFQDGGVTPYNNPALLAYAMATQPEYTVRWPSGEDNLLVVSVGTGLAAAAQAKRVTVLPRIKHLPAIFMNGASISQDYLCRMTGTTKFGLPIDREIGRVPQGHGQFTYVRYNVDLGDLGELRTSLVAAGADAAALAELDRIASLPTRKMLKLNAPGNIDDLLSLGRLAGQLVDTARHFAGFAP